MNIFSAIMGGGTCLLGIFEMKAESFRPDTIIYWAALIGIALFSVLVSFGAKLFQTDIQNLIGKWTGKIGKHGKDGQLMDSKHS